MPSINDVDNESTISSLSSAPSGLFSTTPVSEPEPNPSLMAPALALQHRQTKARTGYAWLPENGVEIIENGVLKWKCVRCSHKSNPITYVGTSTTWPNRHLQRDHSVYSPVKGAKQTTNATESNQAVNSSYQRTLQEAFGSARTKPAPLEFNYEHFKRLFVNSVISNNLGFNIVTDTSYRDLLGYLAACVSHFISIVFFLLYKY